MTLTLRKPAVKYEDYPVSGVVRRVLYCIRQDKEVKISSHQAHVYDVRVFFILLYEE